MGLQSKKLVAAISHLRSRQGFLQPPVIHPHLRVLDPHPHGARESPPRPPIPFSFPSNTIPLRVIPIIPFHVMVTLWSRRRACPPPSPRLHAALTIPSPRRDALLSGRGEAVVPHDGAEAPGLRGHLGLKRPCFRSRGARARAAAAAAAGFFLTTDSAAGASAAARCAPHVQLLYAAIFRLPSRKNCADCILRADEPLGRDGPGGGGGVIIRGVGAFIISCCFPCCWCCCCCYVGVSIVVVIDAQTVERETWTIMLMHGLLARGRREVTADPHKRSCARGR